MCFSAQFEDYKWRQPKSAVFGLLEKKGKKIDRTLDSENETAIRYSDYIFNEPCEVTLFTHNKYGLYIVTIEWGKSKFSLSAFKKNLVKILSDKYGEFVYRRSMKPDLILTERYSWNTGVYKKITMVVSEDKAFDRDMGTLILIYSDDEIVKELKRQAKMMGKEYNEDTAKF